MRLPVFLVFLAAAVASAGCNSILGIDDHDLAPPGSPGPGEGGIPLLDGGLQPDTGSLAQDSGVTGDGAPAEAGSPGGAVPPTSGGIYSVDRVPVEGGVALPDGGFVTLTDDGFEFGETLCDTTGMTCVTGSLTP
jgi:hypothetical protein